MRIKLKYFVYILLLAYFHVTADEDKALDRVIQSKDIHIVGLQGNLGELKINATYKDIKLLNVVANSNESLFSHLIGQNLMQTQDAQREDLTAIIGELKSQISQLNDTLLHLENLLTERDEEKEKPTSSSCSVLDPVGSVQLISVPGIEPFWVLCDACGAGMGWIAVQRRFDGSLNFYRDWNAYRNGFGLYNGEFFIGLEFLHRLTRSRPYELYVELVDFNNHMFHAQYDSFLVGSEEEKYMLKSLGAYSGNAGDSLKYNLYDKFSTYDNDNDGWSRGNCANYYASGWWFNWDANSNLNGRYFKTGEQNVKGIWLYTLNRYYSLKSVKMLIRPKYTLI